jgi:hypothetical protein
MEKFKFLVRQARAYLQTADHLVYVTYPLVNETKMLLVVAENLYKASTKAINAILYREKLYKRIISLPDEWEQRLRIFEKIAPKYNLPASVQSIPRKLWTIVKEYEKSPMAFSRKDKFIITDEKFTMQTLDVTLLKKYVSKIRTLITTVEAIQR